jgi:predicted  nucleic acid-binding Zn-ribbon protein
LLPSIFFTTKRLAAQMTSIQESLPLASQERDELKQRVIILEQEKSDLELSSLAGLTARMTSFEESLQASQLASQERDELKQRVITLEQEKSDFLVDLVSSLKEECAELKSELTDVKK